MQRLATLSLVFLSFLCNKNLLGQTPAIEWQKCFGGNHGEYAYSIQQTSDGGYVAAGTTEGTDYGDVLGYHGNPAVLDIWIIKLDKDGNLEWQKCLGGNSVETGGYIHQLPDGGYIVGGSSASVDCNITGNHGGLDFWLVRLNGKGDVLWQKMYGGSLHDYCYSLAVANDGNFFMAGSTQSSDGDVTMNHGGGFDFWVIKVDGSGNLIWQKTLGGSTIDQAFSVQATPDGGCVTAGSTLSNDGDVTGNHGDADYWVVKLTSSGAIQWQKTLGGSQGEEGRCIQLTADGGYIVAGGSVSYDGDLSGRPISQYINSDCWVVKLNNTGSIQWQKCYGSSRNDGAYFVQQTPDGGYVLAGTSEFNDGDLTCFGGVDDFWVFKIDGLGNKQWQKSMGGDNFDQGFCIQPTSDGGYIACGITCSSNIPHHPQINSDGTCGDDWIIKLSPPLAVQPTPSFKIDPLSANICLGNSATLTTSILNADPNIVYQWVRNGVVVSATGPSYTSSDFADNDLVVCNVRVSNNCGTQPILLNDQVMIKVKSNVIRPSITIATDNIYVCPCADKSFRATVAPPGSGPVFQWQVDGYNTGNNSPYFVSNNLKSGDVVTCIYADNADCVASGQIISNAIHLLTASLVQPTISIATLDNNTCAGSPILLTATAADTGAHAHFQWMVNGLNAGSNNNTFTSTSFVNGDVVTCSVTSDSLASCLRSQTVSSNQVVIAIVPKAEPSITISSSANNICVSTPVSFTAVQKNAGTNPSYEWQVNGVDVAGNIGTFMSSTLKTGDIVSCIVKTDPSFSCANHSSAQSNSIAMVVNNGQPPTISVQASANNVCAGTPVSFIANITNSGPSSGYSWILNGRPVGTNSPMFTSNQLANGDFVSCVLQPDNLACSTAPDTSNLIPTTIKPLPDLQIIPADTTIDAGKQVKLTINTTSTIQSFQWSPADQLLDPNSLNPETVALTSKTVYTLVVTDDKGCVAEKIATVKIFFPFYMPNAFTPNHDGKNDEFRIPPGVSLNLSEFSIYNRWGQKIFTTKNPARGWDGNLAGVPVASDVYIYVIKGKNEKSDVLVKGTFALIR